MQYCLNYSGTQFPDGFHLNIFAILQILDTNCLDPLEGAGIVYMSLSC